MNRVVRTQLHFLHQLRQFIGPLDPIFNQNRARLLPHLRDVVGKTRQVADRLDDLLVVDKAALSFDPADTTFLGQNIQGLVRGHARNLKRLRNFNFVG